MELRVPVAPDAIADALGPSLAADLAAGRVAELAGWSLASVAPRTFRQTVCVATFAREGATLAFIVTPRSEEPAYRRSAHFDLVYFSEDVPDAEQGRIYQRDRAAIDAFARWLAAWDARTLPAA